MTEKWQEKEYCLIRLGVPMLLWQNLRRVEGNQEEVQENAMEKVTEKATGIMQENVERLLAELPCIQTALCFLGNNPNWTYCAYEGTLREKIDMEIWQQYWDIPEFAEYHVYPWVGMMMEKAVCDRYLILGYAPCLGKILCGHAEKMRSATWYLQQEQYTQAVQNFVEDFYQEYGLAIELHVLGEDESWRKVHPSSQAPVNVLDFSGEEKLSACNVAKGSIWLDMDSLEGKSRRMETRNPQITYFSLKKLWKQRQKERILLDTISKNRYNT